MPKLFICLSFFILYLHFPLFASNHSANALTLFDESFNGKLDNSLSWDVYNSDGISYSTSSVILTQPNNRVFPYLRTNTPITKGKNGIIDVKFRYLSLGSSFGNGIAITDKTPEYGNLMNFPSAFIENTMFYIWQGANAPLHIGTSICSDIFSNCLNSIYFPYWRSFSYQSHVFRVKWENGIFDVYIDDELVYKTSQTNRIPKYVWIGHPLISNGGIWTSFEVDYVKSYLTTESNYFSQLDPTWAEEEYDSASQWAGEDSYGIGRWGCALTSAAMVMKHYDVELPSNDSCEEADPSKLNQWLISQDDGYVGNGYVNWIALTRFARESHENNCSDTELEFARAQYGEDVVVEFPSILGLHGHFVVAEDEDDDSFRILDPANQANTLVAKEDVISTNTFVPSLTDLSYIYAVSDPEIKTEIVSKDRLVKSDDYYLDPLKDDTEEGDNGQGINNSLIAKPPSGKYIIELENLSYENYQGTVYLYLYNEKGEVEIVDLEAELLPQQSKYYSFSYDKYNNSQFDLEEMNFEDLVWWLYQGNEIFDYDKATHLVKYSHVIDKFRLSLKVRNLLVSNINRYLTNHNPTYISDYAYGILSSYIF